MHRRSRAKQKLREGFEAKAGDLWLRSARLGRRWRLTRQEMKDITLVMSPSRWRRAAGEQNLLTGGDQGRRSVRRFRDWFW